MAVLESAWQFILIICALEVTVSELACKCIFIIRLRQGCEIGMVEPLGGARRDAPRRVAQFYWLGLALRSVGLVWIVCWGGLAWCCVGLAWLGLAVVVQGCATRRVASRRAT